MRRFLPRILAAMLMASGFLFMPTAARAQGGGDMDIRGIPQVPGQLRMPYGTYEHDVNLLSGFGWIENELFSMEGRGKDRMPLLLYYSTDLSSMEGKDNLEGQASWVGLGFGLEAPFIFNEFTGDDLEYSGGGDGEPVSIDFVSDDYALYWDGVRDEIIEGGTYALKDRKYWKVTKNESGGSVTSFVLTDLDGTEYTFGHRRKTIFSVHNELTEEIDDYVIKYYRWDLTKIEDVTGQNSLTISYTDVNYTLEDLGMEGESYTQASYLYRITDDVSGRVVEFTRASRTDKPSDVETHAQIFEKQRLDYFTLKDSTNGTVRLKYDFSNNAYFSSGSTQKLKLNSVQRKHPTSAGDLPAWTYSYRTSDPNLYALEKIEYPEGGTRTIAYGTNWTSASNLYRVKSITDDFGMGGTDATFTFAPYDSSQGRHDWCRDERYMYWYLGMEVIYPGSTGSKKFETNSWNSYGTNMGTLSDVLTLDDSDNIVERMEYNPADTSVVFRKYSLMRQTVYQGSDSLKTETRTWYNTSNGLPRLIKEQVRPFDTRGYSATPSQVDSYWRSRQIEYAFESHETGMNASGTHQLAPVWEEIVREETHSTANGDKTAPIQTTWRTYSQYGSAYYYPHKTWLWTGADAAADTTLPSDPPTNTSEKVTVREVTSMDAYGHILVEKDGEGRITKYYYGDNSTNVSNAATGLGHRFLTAVRRLAGSSDDNNNDLITETDWDEFRGYKTKETDANDSDIH